MPVLRTTYLVLLKNGLDINKFLWELFQQKSLLRVAKKIERKVKMTSNFTWGGGLLITGCGYYYWDALGTC